MLWWLMHRKASTNQAKARAVRTPSRRRRRRRRRPKGLSAHSMGLRLW